MATSSNENRDHWIGLATQTANRINIAWWLDRLSAPLVILSTAGACVLLMLRRESPTTPLWQYSAGVGIALGLLALGAWLVARRKFETPDQSLVRLEAAMKLRSTLSAAKAGVTAWPNPLVRVESGMRWNWPRLLVPTLGAVLLLAAGLFIPVSALPVAKKDTEEPQAWKKIESDLDKLAQDAVVDETYIEDMKKKLEELRAQKEEDWFSHSSLEASDSLKKEHQSELKRMERELERADKAMGNIQKNATGGEADPAKLANEFEQALQGLQNGAMKPNPELLKQLKSLDPKNLGQITPEQMQQLKDNLGKASEAMKGMQGQGEGQGDWEDQLQAGDGEGQGNKPGNGGGEGEGGEDGQDGEGAGKGGVSRGPGHTPGALGKESNKTETGDLTGLDAKDLSRATPGDLLQLQDGEHEIDKSPSKIGAGGGTQATGQGGDRVWKESLDPDEQRAMKKFFNE